MLYVISLGQLHVELATYKLGDPLNTFLLLALCLSQHSIHRTPIRETMYTSLQNRRRLNQLSLPLQLLHIPIRAHKLPLQEPRLLARQPQEKMRRQTHCNSFSRKKSHPSRTGEDLPSSNIAGSILSPRPEDRSMSVSTAPGWAETTKRSGFSTETYWRSLSWASLEQL